MVILCVKKGNICNPNYHKLYYFSQISPIHPTPKVSQGNLPTSLTCFGQQNLSECEPRHIPVGALNASCSCAQALLFFLPQERACTRRDGSFRLGLQMRRHLGRAGKGRAWRQPPRNHQYMIGEEN